jgi:hypothetical protein
MADYDPRGKLEDRDAEQPPPDTRNGIAACPAAAGRPVTDTCTACQHVLMAHGRDGYCAICVTAARLGEMQFDPRQLIATSDHVLDDALAARKEKIWDDGYQAGLKAAEESPAAIMCRLADIERALHDLPGVVQLIVSRRTHEPKLSYESHHAGRDPDEGRRRAAEDTVQAHGPDPDLWPQADRERLEEQGAARFAGAPEPDDVEPYGFDPAGWPATNVTVTNGSWRGLTGLLTGRRRQARP